MGLYRHPNHHTCFVFSSFTRRLHKPKGKINAIKSGLHFGGYAICWCELDRRNVRKMSVASNVLCVFCILVLCFQFNWIHSQSGVSSDRISEQSERSARALTTFFPTRKLVPATCYREKESEKSWWHRNRCKNMVINGTRAFSNLNQLSTLRMEQHVNALKEWMNERQRTKKSMGELKQLWIIVSDGY